jgi:hypothetical protein
VKCRGEEDGIGLFLYGGLDIVACAVGWGGVGDLVACSSSTSSGTVGDEPLLPVDSTRMVG